MSGVNINTDAMVRKYEPLIYSVLSKKLNRYLEDDDLIQVGRIVLWKCAKRYDPDKGRFSTYAYRAIYHAMLNELSKRKSDVSLNATVPGEDGLEFQDMIEDLNQSLEGVELKFELVDFMKTLNQRRQEILKRKARGETRREIAKALDVSYYVVVRELKEISKQWKEFHTNMNSNLEDK